METDIDGSLMPGQKGQPGGNQLWDKKNDNRGLCDGIQH